MRIGKAAESNEWVRIKALVENFGLLDEHEQAVMIPRGGWVDVPRDRAEKLVAEGKVEIVGPADPLPGESDETHQDMLRRLASEHKSKYLDTLREQRELQEQIGERSRKLNELQQQYRSSVTGGTGDRRSLSRRIQSTERQIADLKLKVESLRERGELLKSAAMDPGRHLHLEL